MKKLRLYFFASLATLAAGLLYASGLAALNSSPWVPTRHRDLERLVRILGGKRGQTIYDLGAGDGRLCVALARHTQSRVVGIELSLFYFLLAKIRVAWHGLGDRVTIVWGNFYRQTLSPADIVVFYLTPKTSQRLLDKLTGELRKKALVYSYRYPIRQWQYDVKIQETVRATPIYRYQIGSIALRPSFTYP